MKVRFVGVEGVDPSARQGSHVLRPDRDYVVLGIECQSDGPNYFRIETTRGEWPPLLDSRLFEVTDAQVSAIWTARIGWEGSVSLQPEEWQREGFWEDFTNHDLRAAESYDRYRDHLLTSGGR
ncbi:hypothetical protein [Streptomyces sp. JJ38]|uniref:hypothetical protein n=1 Tax=Streptomyces sp. JJ38 TaxID=2738128 RepID=UPI001C598526|nr:hypothetical protein [Streptomyces sp. JJ38]MBW1596836.1 hypothetical protein [Streptomyces sp. JJ38]